MNCPLCEARMDRLMDMSGFPITEKLEPWTPDYTPGRYTVDQDFNYCESCGHGRLGTVVPDLYGSDYRTTTSMSEGATQAVRNFHAFIADAVDVPQTVIDIGANDYTLLNLFKSEQKVAIDKCVNGVGIEDADLSRYAVDKKLIISSHTIEHLVDPEIMISKCSEIMGVDDVLALQFPSLELLVEDARIDQIHHQHIHYFSLRSISSLLSRHGLRISVSRFDPSHWGALQLIAVKGKGEVTGKTITHLNFRDAYVRFRNELDSTVIPEGSIALGAALMLPVLAYWMHRLHSVEMICDDDRGKDGMRYVNFNKPIGFYYDLKNKDVVITAIGSKNATRSLVKKCMDQGARRIILPLHTL